jgi:hypothetical protein
VELESERKKILSTVATKVQRLLDATGGRGPGGGGCDYCGGDDEDNRGEPYDIFFEDEVPEDLEENCPKCGRELILSIYFEEDPRAPWNVG